MKHIAALITAGVLIGAALIATAFADNGKSGNCDNANPADDMPLLTVESFKEYYEGVVTAQGEITYNYDALGRCISVVTADGFTVISYDNNTVTKTDGDEVTVYEYDANGNLLSRCVYSGGVLINENRYTYDEEGRKLSYFFSFTAQNTQSAIETPVMTAPPVEDNKGSVQSEPGKPVGGIISPAPVDITALNSGETRYTYSEDGLLIKEVSINGRGDITRVSEYTYSEDGVLLSTAVTDADGKLVCIYRCEYDAEGRLVSEGQYDADNYCTSSTDYSYNEEGRLAVKAVVTSMGTEISREEHFYDELGNEIRMDYYAMGALYRETCYEYTSLGAFNLGR